MLKRMLLIFLVALIQVTCHATSIDGTTSAYHKSSHYVLRDQDAATGFVRFSNGFTILPATNHGSSATLNTYLPCSGGFDLRGTSTLILGGNLLLDGAITLTSSGKIYGNSTSLVLGGNLTLAANQILHLDGNLIIDGQGHDLYLNEHAQVMLDVGATVTIKNATIHNKRNNPGWPSIAITTTTTRLTLSDVELALDSDFYVNSGQVFVHNDVAVTGTSAVVWRSCGPCTIEPQSSLYFDSGTTFSYAPATDNKDLVRMSDASSVLALNGCSLKATHTGLRMVKGCVLFGDKVMVDGKANNTLNSLEESYSGIYGSIFARGVSWSPDGKYLAVGGNNSNNDLTVYSFDGTSLTALPGAIKAYGSSAYSVSWSPDGKYLAVGGNNSNNDLTVYSFDGASLAELAGTIKAYGTYATSVSWSPDGKYLAVGGDNGDNDLTVYNCRYLVDTASPTLSNCITFGNNTAGASFDATIKLLAGTQVGVTGLLNIDNVTATPDFASSESRFILQTSASKLKLNPATVPGWKASSITRLVSSDGEGDYNLKSLANAEGSITQALAQLSLVYSSSLAIEKIAQDQARSIDLRSGVADTLDEYDDHQAYAINTTLNTPTSFNAGFTVSDGATLTLDITYPVAGNINLSGSGALKLDGDLVIDADGYLTSGGVINGNGQTLVLTSSLVLPANKKLKITGNVAIDGQGNSFKVDQGARLVIDANVSVTLRNMNWLNGNSNPHLEMWAENSQLTLDNVNIKFDRDFTFTQGKLFVYNDVVVTGTKTVSYASSRPLMIEPFSALRFDQGTTFGYGSAGRTLVQMIDRTSALSCDNCALDLGSNGMQLTKGTVLFNNKVSVTTGATDDKSFEFGDGLIESNDIDLKVLSDAQVEVNGYWYHHPAA